MLTIITSVVCAGGEDDQDQPLNAVERFDLRSCKWESLPPMEDALTDPPAAAHGQFIYVLGGLLGLYFTSCCQI